MQKPIFPPRAEVERLQESKPVPSIAIVTSELERELYNAELEMWADRLSAAGRRVCQWFNDNGGKFDCQPPPAGRPK